MVFSEEDKAFIKILYLIIGYVLRKRKGENAASSLVGPRPIGYSVDAYETRHVRRL